MTQDVEWTLWRSFLAVAENGSLSAAARVLRLTQPTIGRHIDGLETAIGKPLFLRSPQGLVLTETAISLLPEARAMQFAAESLVRRASTASGSETGTVRLAASHVVGAEILPALLSPLLRQHPGLSVELALSNESADLLRHEADIAIRMIRPRQGTLIARRLASVPLRLHAHRDYLERMGRPSSLGALSGHTMIGPDRDQGALQGLKAFNGEMTRAGLRLRTDSEAAQIAAIRAGLGIGVLQCGIARRDPMLEPVLEDVIGWELDAWLVVHEDLRHLPVVRLLVDYLVANLPALLDPRV